VIVVGMVVEASAGCSCSNLHEVAAGNVYGGGVCNLHMVPPVEVAVGSNHCTELVVDSNYHGAA
jgi:hypothetical protein